MKFAGIMFQDITTLLLDHKAFKDTVDIFVDRYRDMHISVVAGTVLYSTITFSSLLSLLPFFFFIEKPFFFCTLLFLFWELIFFVIWRKTQITDIFLLFSLIWFLSTNQGFECIQVCKLIQNKIHHPHLGRAQEAIQGKVLGMWMM